MKIIIINGPNLNLLGIREQSVYGEVSFDDFFKTLKSNFSTIELSYFQSNVEGELINKIQETGFSFDGIILNAGAYT
ncbi:MAG TPA: type II 3-dehydroquinate dehydratase, partial [Bacteroidia bacterium]|nr:type II 3-dehydroquinate dehydratase [Bacteroidia bacterium]